MRHVRVALLGCGTVGGGLARLLERSRDLVAAKHGVEFTIVRALVRDVDRPRDGVEPARLTSNREHAIPPVVDVVVEALGGLEPARTLVVEALELGLPVVTANKALLARHGQELFALAARTGATLAFEASVGGGVPMVRAIREALAGNRIERLSGILNGTCNFLLSRMARDGCAFDHALEAAQDAGFAEADPSLDVDGWDAAQKLVVLSALAFGEWVPPARVRVRGIREVTHVALAEARCRGRVVRLVASAERSGAELDLRVAPCELPLGHPLAGAKDEQNALLVEGDVVGELTLVGRGAGAGPTATALLADLCDVFGRARESVPRTQLHARRETFGASVPHRPAPQCMGG
jgi:homoserine dehydrogenase